MTNSRFPSAIVAGTLAALAAPMPAVRAAATPFDCTGIAPVAGSALVAVPVVEGLAAPLFATSPAGDRERLFVVEQGGRIRLWKRGSAPGSTTLFLDVSTRLNSAAGEQGLLGLAFPADYAAAGDFYIKLTEPRPGCGAAMATAVYRFRRSAGDPDLADPASGTRVLSICQPFSNHNGGWMAFGGDGLLYVATGDGGSGGDPGGNGQSLTTLLGKILRLDVRGAAPGTLDPACDPEGGYRVPADNPFVGGAPGTCSEIWAYGLRNPWRNSIDPANGDLYIGDVGQGCWEEINHAPAASAAGTNFGWRSREGSRCYPPATCSDAPCLDASCACGALPSTLPIHEYPNNATTCAVTGGEVYRGCLLPDLHGTYFFGDFCGRWVRSFTRASGTTSPVVDWSAQLGTFPNLNSFGRDATGELYVVSGAASPAGRVFRLTAPFASFQVSATGAEPLRFGPGGWSWEDLSKTSGHPVGSYRIYRGVPGPDAVFSCIASSTSTGWADDGALPQPGTALGYLVVAINGGATTNLGSRPGGAPPPTLGGACP